MKKTIVIVLVAVLAGALLYLVPTYNRLQKLDESVTAQWAEVINQYQRRADLVPNLVETVKGYAAHEEAVFTQVTEARAKVAGTPVTPNLPEDEAALARFQNAQSELSGALARLLVVAENYPELKANEMFGNLMTQLEGTENRIATARRHYIDGVQEFNSAIRAFPGNIIAGFSGLQRRATFSVADEAAISTAPAVQFN